MNCIIVDDEYPSREELKFLIRKYSKINIVKEFENPIEALKYLEGNSSIDIIFLDINMPNFDGISLAKIISKFKIKPKIVFVTAYKEYAIDAFEVEAIDYILKPYSEDRIKKLIERIDKTKIIDVEKEHINKITLSNGERILVLDKEDISVIKAFERHIVVTYKEKTFEAKIKFSEIAKDLLIDVSFFQTHRSYIVNLNKISEIDHYFNNTYLLTLIGSKDKIPVSRNYIKEFKNIMKL